MTELSPRARRFAEALDGWPRRRVTGIDLWRLLDEADPSGRGASGRRRVLAGVVEELALAGFVVLPAAGSFDRSENPPLPRFVTLPAPAAAEPTPKAEVWHPKLGWVDGARVTGPQRELLAKVNRWLFRGRDDHVVPLRERSLEILGDEKALDGRLATSLFADDRLSLDLLRARRVVPPLHTARIGDGKVLLVVENSDTFDSLIRALAPSPGRIGHVAWGAGAGFEASVLSISAEIREIRYFGDLDRSGLRIPANASNLAVLNGLPPVQPAIPLYEALFQLGIRQPGRPVLTESDAIAAVEWLAPIHRIPARELLTAGHRLAQEAVGLTHLSTSSAWRDI